MSTINKFLKIKPPGNTPRGFFHVLQRIGPAAVKRRNISLFKSVVTVESAAETTVVVVEFTADAHIIVSESIAEETLAFASANAVIHKRIASAKTIETDISAAPIVIVPASSAAAYSIGSIKATSHINFSP